MGWFTKMLKRLRLDWIMVSGYLVNTRPRREGVCWALNPVGKGMCWVNRKSSAVPLSLLSKMAEGVGISLESRLQKHDEAGTEFTFSQSADSHCFRIENRQSLIHYIRCLKHGTLIIRHKRCCYGTIVWGDLIQWQNETKHVILFSISKNWTRLWV